MIRKILSRMRFFYVLRKQDMRYFISLVQAKFNGADKESRGLIRQYKNKYKGQRCFIIGNGPSLRIEDLEKLKDEIVFSSNGIIKIRNMTEWRPTFYSVFDEGMFKDEENIKECNDFECSLKIFRLQGYRIYKKIKGRKCYLFTKYSRRYANAPEFSTDIEKEIYTIATVTYALMQIAVYMGFEEIYLLGMDNQCTVRNQGKTQFHFYCGKDDEMCGKDAANDMYEKMLKPYIYAENFSKAHGFKIYNVTRGGALEIFERKDFEEVIKSN